MTPGFPGAAHSRFRADARRGATRCRITKDMTRRLSRRLIRAALPPIEAAMSEIVQVSLRGTRKEFFLNSRNLWLRLRDKIIVPAEHRVDFRELVKDLAAKLHARIELRQIGVRDQARRMDGCGPCGRAFCCSTWLKDFHPVTLKMAREQQLALNPGKISGACGRLMCCLSYELTQYRDSAEGLPPVGAVLRTGQGPMTVLRTEVYPQAVVIRDDEGGEHRIRMTDLPPGPYHKCGDCNCGKKSKTAGNGAASGTAGGGEAEVAPGGDAEAVADAQPGDRTREEEPPDGMQ